MINITFIDKLVGAKTCMSLPDGLSIDEAIDRCKVPAVLLNDAEAWIDYPSAGRTWLVPRDRWPSVKPKPGIDITVRAYGGKGGGGGKSVLGVALSIAVMAASAFAGFELGGAAWAIAAFGKAGAGVFGGLVSGAIPISGPLYIGNTLEKKT